MIEKAGLLDSDNSKDIKDKICVGIDGSLFEKTPGYRERMLSTLKIIIGEKYGNMIELVHSRDGSGIGAAIAAAAVVNFKVYCFLFLFFCCLVFCFVCFFLCAMFFFNVWEILSSGF